MTSFNDRKTVRARGRARRFIALAAAALFAILCIDPLGTRAAASEDESGLTMEFLTYKESSMLEILEMNAGDSIQLQLKLTEDIVYAGVRMMTAGEGAVMDVGIYNWDRNMTFTLEGQPLLTRTVSGWEQDELIGLDLSQLPGGSLGAGEYLMELTLKEGAGVRVDRYKPHLRGVICYVNGTHVYGSYVGKIITARPAKELYDFASTQVDIPVHTPEPESVIAEDSAIARMGVDPTTWTAVDGLGRTLPDNSQTGGKKDKKVGIFYWTWHYNFMGNKVCNVNNILAEYPEARNDYYHEIWKTNQSGSYFWNEPIYGYYTEYDDYVLRNHAELLADAGVDFVLFDCTNGNYTWEPAYLNLLKVWSQAREDGIKTPQIGFMMQFGWSGNTLSSLSQIYEAIYKEGKYQDLWFYWEGKPLVMAHNSGLDLSDQYQAEIANFFTFRGGDASYFGGDNTDSYWGWLHKYPQALYKNADGTVEMTTVGIAMNADYELMGLAAMNGPHNMGRSYSFQPDYKYTYKYRGRTVVCKTGMEDSKLYGINFQEQWDYAISVDPEIVFVTGWNEWIAGRNVEWCGVANGFPDECDDENSRDIEPSKGDLKDHYYYQLVANIRRFKGTSSYEVQPKAKSIDVHAGTDAWSDGNIVTYNHYVNNRYDRDSDGWSGTHYVNSGVRNDIKTAKVSYDNKYVYFYVETVDPLTDPTDDNWMRLLIDTKEATSKSLDWEEFEFIVNRVSPDAKGLVVERSRGGWNWKTVGYADYDVSGSVLQLKIPRSVLGLRGSSVTFNFKWCDNNLADGDILTLYTDGDAAPGGRFCFHFTSAKPGQENLKPLLAALGALAVLAAAAALTLAVKNRKR